MEKRLTVFTPTYNRAHTLGRCYESLCNQKCQSFKWLIIDDGSNDNTVELVREWQEENRIEIKYVYKENGGLHTGYNTAIGLLDTELSMCIDSDDYVAENAVEKILTFWDENKDEKSAGIVGMDFDTKGNRIGCALTDYERVDGLSLLARKGCGDKKYVVLTEAYKEVSPMPVFEGEKNFNPHYLILKLSKKYNFISYNEPLCIVEYQENGMSANIFKQYVDSPRSFMELRRVIMELPCISLKYLVKTTMHYIASSILAEDKKMFIKSPRKVLTILLLIPGIILSFYIKRNSGKVFKVID